ncbi:hypothetical protein M23134_01145 [Microscilla marina ATCC 23134]|uniref:Uncharacterized protein n=1 Tax=Microscilla marina ATCC 23134 TaxID=313606 RepID=A1ZFP7_MICM2|nr:hypothetical protein M23134_01145 [Microscilla marina ATCC 23134]
MGLSHDSNITKKWVLKYYTCQILKTWQVWANEMIMRPPQNNTKFKQTMTLC